MELISRYKSLSLIKDKSGLYWICRRCKRKKDSRRRVITRHSIRYIPIENKSYENLDDAKKNFNTILTFYI